MSESKQFSPTRYWPFHALRPVACGADGPKVCEHVRTSPRQWFDVVEFGSGIAAGPAAIVPVRKLGLEFLQGERMRRCHRLAGASHSGVEFHALPVIGVAGVFIAVLQIQLFTVGASVRGLVVAVAFTLSIFGVVVLLPFRVGKPVGRRTGLYLGAVAVIVIGLLLALLRPVPLVPFTSPLAGAFFAGAAAAVAGGAVRVEGLERFGLPTSVASFHAVDTTKGVGR